MAKGKSAMSPIHEHGYYTVLHCAKHGQQQPAIGNVRGPVCPVCQSENLEKANAAFQEVEDQDSGITNEELP